MTYAIQGLSCRPPREQVNVPYAWETSDHFAAWRTDPWLWKQDALAIDMHSCTSNGRGTDPSSGYACVDPSHPSAPRAASAPAVAAMARAWHCYMRIRYCRSQHPQIIYAVSAAAEHDSPGVDPTPPPPPPPFPIGLQAGSDPAFTPRCCPPSERTPLAMAPTLIPRATRPSRVRRTRACDLIGSGQRGPHSDSASTAGDWHW